MLILSRKASECIHLGDDIVLTIVAVGNDKVRIGVQAPPGVKILRTELEIETTAAPATDDQPQAAAPPAPLKIVNESSKSAKVSKFESFVRQIRRAA